METKTIETSLSLKQLGSEFRQAHREYKRNLSKYRKSKGAKKLPYLAKVQKYIMRAQAAFKKIEAKLIRESEAIALNISNDITKNPREAHKLMPEFDKIDEVLARIERDEGIEMRKSYGEMRLARGIRNRIISIKSVTWNKVKKQEAEITNIIKMDEHRKRIALRQQHIAQAQQKRTGTYD